MPEWREVMEARTEATAALADVNGYGGAVEDGREGDAALAACLAARAVCLELRALGTLIGYASQESQR